MQHHQLQPQLRHRTTAAMTASPPSCRRRRFAAAAAAAQQHTSLSSSSGYVKWREQFFPVGFLDDLEVSPRLPVRFELLGEPLCLWRDHLACDDAAAGWRAVRDVCPHRLVPLSEGRVTERGRISCGYHGWEWAGDDPAGALVRLPQLEHDPAAHARACANPRACARVYDTRAAQGLLFVRLQPPPQQQQQQAPPLPTVPELDENDEGGGGGWLVSSTWRDVPLDFLTVLENVADASHVPITHHNSISSRRSLGAYDIRLDSPPTLRGFTGAWATGPRAGALGPQTTRFEGAACLLVHKIDARATKGYESLVVVYAVPQRPGFCRLINRNAFRFVGGSGGSGGSGPGGGLGARLMRLAFGGGGALSSSSFAAHLATQVPLEDDQLFLHAGERAAWQALPPPSGGGDGAGAAAPSSSSSAPWSSSATAASTSSSSASSASSAPPVRSFMPSAADTYVAALGRWMREFAGDDGPFGGGGYTRGGGPGHLARLPPVLPREAQLDRYNQHTSKCATCLRALARVRAARTALRWLSAGAAGAALLCAAVSAAVAGAGGGGGGGGGGVAAAFAAALLRLSGADVGGSLASAAPATAAAAAAAAGAAGAAARALAFALVGCAAAAGAAGLDRLEAAFFAGSYPPPRNKDLKD